MVTVSFQKYSEGPVRIIELESLETARNFIKERHITKWDYIVVAGKLKVLEGELEIID